MADMRLQIVLGTIDKATAPMRKILGGSQAMSESLKNSRAALKTLQDTSKNISSFQKTRAELKSISRQYDESTAKLATLRIQLDAQRGSQQQMAGQVKTAREAFKLLSVEMARTSVPSETLHRTYQQQKAELEKLNARYNSSQSSLRSYKQQIKNTEQASKKLGEKQTHLKDKLDRVKTTLERAGIGTAQMATRQRALRGEIAQTNTQIEQQAQRLNKLAAARERADKMHAGGKRMVETGLGMAYGGRRVLNAGIHALSPGLAFDASMSKVQALTGLDKDDPVLKQLRDDARALASRTKFNPAQVAEGQRFLAMAGFDPQSILGSMQSMLNIAIAGDIEIDGAANIVSNISSAFGIDPTDIAAMTQLADQLVTGFSNANVDLTQLGETMKYFAPVAKAAGIDTSTSIAMAGMLGNIGIQGSDAGTALRSMTTRLAAPPTEARKALSQLGVTTKDKDGNMRNIVEIMAGIDAAFKRKRVGGADRLGYLKNIFGQRAMAGGSNLTELMADAMGEGTFAAYFDIIQNSEDNAEKIAKVMANNLTGDWNNLISAFQDVMLSLNDAIGPTLRALAQSVSALLLRLNAWIKDNPHLAKVLGLAALAVTGLVTALGALAMTGGIALMMLSHTYKALLLLKSGFVWAAKGAWWLGSRALILLWKGLMLTAKGAWWLGGRALLLLKSSLMLVGKAVLWLGRALLMNPIGLAITGIAVAAYFIYKYWEPIKGFFARLWAGITSGIGWAVEFIKTRLSWTPLAMVLNNWEPIKAFLSALWDGILGGLRQAWDLIVGVLKGAWDVIAGIFTGDGGRIMEGLGGIWDSIQTFMSGWPAKMLQFGVDMLTGLINGIKNMAGAVSNAITGAVSGAVGRFKAFLGIKSPSRLFAGLGDFTMQGYAGGIVRTQSEPVQAVLGMGQRLRKAAAGITLGVAGAAAPVMASSAPVMAPATRSAAPAPAAAPMTINITINAPGGSAPEIAREVRRVIDQVEHERRARTRAWQHDYD